MTRAYINGKYVDYEPEVITLTPEEKQKQYEETVSNLIRQRYSLNEELALHRQRDTKSDEWAAYYAYCEECKQTARGGNIE